MKKALTPCTVALVALALAAPVAAELCAVDNVPAATLLIPYFEVEPTKKGKVNTVISIQNVDLSANATVAHVTLWTDWAVPTLNFDVFLTGYDVATIDLRDLFVNRNLPRTAHAANDPDDTISPHGGANSDNPSWDSAPDNPDALRFEGCDQLLPPSQLPRALIDRVIQGHTGQDTGEGCVGADHGDGVARGYITIDNVTDCSLLFPGEAGYFGTDGVASDLNQLRGEFYITEKSGRGVAAGPAVAIEADPGFSGTGNSYTFYGRYLSGSGADRREPLATTWSVQQPDQLPFGKKSRAVTTDLLIWRDTLDDALQGGYACGARAPEWLPLDETQIVVFDEQSDAVQICGQVVDPVLGPMEVYCAPLATQRVRLGQGDLASPVDPGWTYLNLNHTSVSGANFGGLAQSYVTTAMSVSRLRGTNSATALSSACQTVTRRKRR